jgi:hypothetical protein
MALYSEMREQDEPGVWGVNVGCDMDWVGLLGKPVFAARFWVSGFGGFGCRGSAVRGLGLGYDEMVCDVG